MIKCKENGNTIICSEEVLPLFVNKIVKEIDRIERCDAGGFHIWLKEGEKK